MGFGSSMAYINRIMGLKQIFQVVGEVIHGNKVGRRIGFPTANLVIAEAVPLRDGVYAATVEVEGTTFRAMANLGYKPTLGDGQNRVLEVHLFDFDRDLYHRTITVSLLAFIREEQKFGSVELLREQIVADRNLILQFFETIQV